VEFYELVKPELREILTQDMRVIEGSEANRGIADEVEDGDLEEFDLDVAKAVLLLQHVHDIVPLNEGNIAVSVMSDLNGRSWISTQNRVEESLGRLQKFIRPMADETGRGTDLRRRKNELSTTIRRRTKMTLIGMPFCTRWTSISGGRITQDLSLPESVPYGDSGDEYPVMYGFGLDGTGFETTVDVEGGLDVPIEVQGVRPDHTSENSDEETLYWSIDTDGLDDLRKHLVKWWALRDAISTHNAPTAVEQDLDRRADAVRSKLVSAMQSGFVHSEDRTDISGLSTAVQTAVDVGYPDDFHPMMLQVTDDRLQELVELSTEDPLPAWAHTIQVPSSDPSASQGKKSIQRNVMSLTGRQLKDRDDGLNMNTVLDGITSKKKPFYDEARPALCAIIWGFCREGRLVPVDEDGNTLENSAVLDQDHLSTTRLKLLPREPIGKLLESGVSSRRLKPSQTGSSTSRKRTSSYGPLTGTSGRRPVGSGYGRSLGGSLRAPRSIYRGTDRPNLDDHRATIRCEIAG